jgi:hypothetical protein
MTSNQDGVPTELVAAEIRALRKGRGIRSSDLERRLGQYLRELTDPGDGDVADRRRALANELAAQAAKLQEDMRIAVLASVGQSQETRQMARFGDRVTWLAEQAGRTDRTILRRIESAELLLAEEIAGELRRRRAQPSGGSTGWYLDEFRTVLRLDTPTPESHERRRIVATRAGLTQVMAPMDIPRDTGEPRAELTAEVLYGGRLVRHHDAAGNRFEFIIELPAPLGLGDQHEYALILRLPKGEMKRPHYIFTPEYQCNAFDLTVRFDLDNPPAWVREVRGETVRTFDTVKPGAENIELDGAGEAHVRFEHPTMYLGYGLQWDPGEAGSSPDA